MFLFGHKIMTSRFIAAFQSIFLSKISKSPSHAQYSPGLTLVAAINVGTKLSLSSSLKMRQAILSHHMT